MVTKGNVLVVDDEVNLCRIIGAKLARSGYSVVAVHDGLQAVEKVRESDFDVVLLDLILPKMDGLAALAQIRGIRSALPVIVMTACENTEVLEQAKHYGVSAYVNKPFDLDNLVSLVRSTSNTTVSGRDRRVPDSTILFAAGQPVTLEIHNGCGARLYMSQIQGKDDRTLSVFTPSNAGQAVNVAPRTCVKVGLATSDAFYSFTTQVLKSSEEPEPVLVLEKPSVIYRVQRREHPRIPIRMPVRCGPCSEDGSKTGKLASGETRDLSLGGACMVVPQEMLPGEMLHVEIRPKSSKDKITAVARVVSSRANLSPESEGYIVGCKFVSTDGRIEKLLIR